MYYHGALDGDRAVIFSLAPASPCGWIPRPTGAHAYDPVRTRIRMTQGRA
jgi:hypothetical protein